MAKLLTYGRQVATYERVDLDLLASSGGLSLPAGMFPAYDTVSDDTHAYSAHGTTLARISASGSVETLSVPDTRRITLNDTYVYGTTTSSGGRLVVVPKSTFSSYTTVSINVGASAAYTNSLDGLALNGSGELAVVGRSSAGGFSGARIGRYDLSGGTWTSYTIPSSFLTASTVGFPLVVDGSNLYTSTTRFGGNGQLHRLDYSSGTSLRRIDLSGIPEERLYVDDGELYSQSSTALRRRSTTLLNELDLGFFSPGSFQACTKAVFYDGYVYAVSSDVVSRLELPNLTYPAENDQLTIDTDCSSIALQSGVALSGIFHGAVVY